METNPGVYVAGDSTLFFAGYRAAEVADGSPKVFKTIFSKFTQYKTGNVVKTRFYYFHKRSLIIPLLSLGNNKGHVDLLRLVFFLIGTSVKIILFA